MRPTALAAFLFLFACNVQAQKPTPPTLNAVESLSPKEYLKLPEGIQAIYVGGIMDGVSFTSYNYDLPWHDDYVRCVRSLTVGALAQKVSIWLRANPSWQEGMAGAVAKTLGAYCKPLRAK